MSPIAPLQRLDPRRFDTPALLKQLAASARQLAELKGVAASIPNQGILINTLGMREAKDSSEIENIVTTHDELFKEDALLDAFKSPAAKEVNRYRQALRVGFDRLKRAGLLTVNDLVEVQAVLEENRAGFRKLPGTALQDGAGRVVYVPPDPHYIPDLMGELERFINDSEVFVADPLIKMALIHHQFETIHPFYDGNGRTGRILNVLYLMKEHLLDIPVLYLSSHIMRTKPEYYRLLQAVRDHDAWEAWVLYMLQAVELTAADTINTVQGIRQLLMRYKHQIRDQFRFYSQDLINHLFTHPYTKIEFLQRDLDVSRITATKYIDQLAYAGFVQKHRAGRSNYYVNAELVRLLTGAV